MRAINMKDTHDGAQDRDVRLENFAAELTGAAYSLVLRRGLSDSWLKMELELWRALAETVEKWAGKPPPTASPDDLDASREDLAVELTVSAMYVAMKNDIQAPLLEVERGLSTAFRQVIERFSHVS
jgi:hypothetical protein